MPRLPDGTSYTSGHLRYPNGDTQLRFDPTANPGLDAALGPIGDVDVVIEGATVTVDEVPYVIVLSPVEDANAALVADPPIQREVMERTARVLAEEPAAPTDFTAARVQLNEDLTQLRAFVQQARNEIAALPLPRTASEQEAVKVRRFLILICKVLLNGVFRPVTGDLDDLPV